jgi:hypothetical protein
MSNPSIPSRQPIEDHFDGAILRSGDHYLLATEPYPDAETLGIGRWIIRYGIAYLGKPHYSIVPGLLALDYGEFLTGEDAWHFLLHRSNLYPRADVVGYRNDGTEDMVFVKQLDLMCAFHILAYPDASATAPLAQISAIITPDPALVPERLAAYTPIYPELRTWEKDTH